MARQGYLPLKDETLQTWTASFSAILSDDAAALSVAPAVAAEYATLQASFKASLISATAEGTRGKRTVFLKDEAKKALVAKTRQIARQINNTMTVTDAQRQQLGLPIPTGHRTPKPAPSQRPILTLENISGRVATIRLRQNGSRRAKPTDATTATILTATGTTRPMTADGFTFAFNTSLTTVDVPFGPSATGDTVWITAFWNNVKGETGPAADPIGVSLPAGGAIQTETPKMRIAKAA